MSLKFRFHRKEDLSAMKQMWVNNTDWGDTFDKVYEAYINNSCLDGARVIIAEDIDSQSIVGQFAFLPYLIKNPTRELKAYRPAAPTVSKDYRYFKGNPLEHPAIKMYTEGARLFKEAGADLIFMVPNPSWIRLMKMFPNFYTTKFPLFSKPLSEVTQSELGSNISYEPIDPADHRIDELWKRFSALHRSMIVRDTRILPWKIGKGDNQVIGVKRNEELIAVLALKAKGDNQWLIDDLIFADCDESLGSALATAERVGLTQSKKISLGKTAVLATPAMEPCLAKKGYKRDAYDFPFVVQTLATDIKFDNIDPSQWFLSAND